MIDIETQILIYVGLGFACFFAGYYYHADSFLWRKRGSNATG